MLLILCTHFNHAMLCNYASIIIIPISLLKYVLKLLILTDIWCEKI